MDEIACLVVNATGKIRCRVIHLPANVTVRLAGLARFAQKVKYGVVFNFFHESRVRT